MKKYNSNTNSHFKCEALNYEEGYFIQRKHTFKCKDKELHLGTRTFIMGILNVTPDSFYDGGRFLNLDDALIQIDKMMNEGADIIDIGGESTRPGSHGVTEEEELRRVVPIIKEAMKRFDVILSIDTTKPRVAKEALGEGASVEDRIEGTAATVAIGVMNGASIVRVHDVLYMKRVARIVDAVMSASFN